MDAAYCISHPDYHRCITDILLQLGFQTIKQMVNNKKKKVGRLSLPPETVARKQEKSSCALIVEFVDGNKRMFWTNEFSANFPSWKIGKLKILVDEFRAWEFFTKNSNRVKSAAIFDTRTEKSFKQEYKLAQWERGAWIWTNYAHLIL